jgi:hypothetical protein
MARQNLAAARPSASGCADARAATSSRVAPVAARSWPTASAWTNIANVARFGDAGANIDNQRRLGKPRHRCTTQGEAERGRCRVVDRSTNTRPAFAAVAAAVATGDG